MSHRAHNALAAYTTPIIRSMKVIVREQIFVATKAHRDVSGGLVADPFLANGRYLELKTDRSRGRLWLGFSQRPLMLPANKTSDGFHVSVALSTYQRMRGDGQTRFDEVVTYHWTANDPNAKRTWPHLHIGSALVNPEARREP